MRDKPNLVVFLSDQLRWDTIGAYGNRGIRTPRLDRLARESAFFERAYATQPVCTPARGSIVTGLYPHNHGCVGNNIPLAEEVPTIAEMADGYNTAYMGKWHLGDEMVAQHGFGTWISTEEYRGFVSRPEYGTLSCTYDGFLRKNGFRPDKEGNGFSAFSRDFATRVPEKYSKPAFVASEARRYIEQNRNEPFILFVTFLEPHPPYYSVFDDMYDPWEVDLPPNYDAVLTENMPSMYHLIRKYAYEVGRDEPLKTEEAWRRLIARYWGATCLVDKYVGSVIDSLEQNGLTDDTAVAFTSDHGDMMGDFRMMQKGVINDSASRVPLLIKIPGVTDGQVRIEKPVGQVDLVPTLLDAMGVTTTANMDGKSLLPAIEGREDLSNNDVFVEWSEGDKAGDWATHYENSPELADTVRTATTAEWRSIITADGWKLCINQTGEHELYNTSKDPYERRNCYGEMKDSGIVLELRRKLDAWQVDHGDTVELP